MHINVRDFLAETVGYNRTYTITGERPQLESVIITADVGGEITISKLESASLLVQGRLATEVQLECHRCLRTFSRPVRVNFKQIYAEQPEDDNLPIVGQEIDVAPLLEQEIILSLPIKILDRPDCPGLQMPDSQADVPAEPDTSLRARAHITKFDSSKKKGNPSHGRP